MGQPTHTSRCSTAAVIKSGEVLLVMKPTAFAAMLCIDDDEYRNQHEIATTVGCSRSTVSTHLTSLSKLSPPLVKQKGNPYYITDDGRVVLELIETMATQLGVDLSAVTWTNPDDKATVETLFGPFSNSRSLLPFFVIESLGALSGSVDRIGQSESVAITDIVADIENRQDERVPRITTAQVRQLFNNRFVSANIVDFDGNESSLTEKGRAHACLVNRLATHVEQTASPDDVDKTIEDTSQISETIPTDASHLAGTSQTTNSLSQQATAQPFRQSISRVIDSPLESRPRELPELIPAYCLRPPEEIDGESDSSFQPTPVLELTSMSATELAEEVSQLLTECDADAQFDVYWTVQTEDGLLPVTPQIGSGDGPHREER